MPVKIITRIAALAVILFLLDRVYTFTLYEEDLREKSPEIVQIRNDAGKSDIYYFGESSNVTYDEKDSTRESISQLTAKFFPGLLITNINKYATHAGIYRHWLEEIRVQNNRPSAVVITCNLRSFGASWIHSELETQLRESLVMAGPYPNIVNRFLLSLQAFDNKTDEQRERDVQLEWRTKKLKFPFAFPYATVHEWDFAMSQGSYLNADGSWDIQKIVLACHYVKAYAFNIGENNPRVKDFDAIADWSDRNGVRVYLNLMAENVTYADSLVGKELVFLMRQNRDFIVSRYNKGNVTVVDNLEAVNGEHFIDQNWTTEHYNYKGRMRVAANLADSLGKRLTARYNKAY